MEIIFGEEISYSDKQYTGLTDPGKHIENYHTVWQEYPRQEWVH